MTSRAGPLGVRRTMVDADGTFTNTSMPQRIVGSRVRCSMVSRS